MNLTGLIINTAVPSAISNRTCLWFDDIRALLSYLTYLPIIFSQEFQSFSRMSAPRIDR
uniref:Uncharacterized protein n=1 Tax=Setaria italica TaxID=4555 RepID=K3Y0S5_SETIT